MPQDVCGNCTPAPRNESPASVRMLLAMISVKKTSTDEATLGKSSESMIRSGLAPWPIAASTNSFWRNERISPRRGLPK